MVIKETDTSGAAVSEETRADERQVSLEKATDPIDTPIDTKTDQGEAPGGISTNAPASSKREDSRREERDSADEGEEFNSRPGKLAKFSTAQEFMLQALPSRAQHADAKLRSNLVGSILVNLRDVGERYHFDWTTEAVKSVEIKGGKTENVTADCTIHISGQNLLKIAAGDLNPQIAMLSDKVKVEGGYGLAIYFFNLVAPRAHN